MAAEWFCEISGRQLGPLSSQQLRAMVENGRLTPEHRVRQGAEGSWVPAGRVKGLFPEDGSPAAVPDSSDALMAQPVKKAAAKPPAKPKPAARRAVKPVGVPVAKPIAQPPAAPAAPRSQVPQARAAAAPPRAPAAAKPAAAMPGGSPFNIVAEAHTPTARATGRSSTAATSPKNRTRQNAILVASLLLLVIGLAVTAIVLTVVNSGSDNTSEKSREQVADAEKVDGENIEDLDPDGAKTPGTDEPSDTPAEIKWLDASKSVARRGDVKVRVLSAETGYPRFSRRLKDPGLPEECLLITVQLENMDSKRKPDYTGWNVRSTMSGRVRLADDLGNTYHPKTFGRATLEGQLTSTTSIYPNESIQDLLVFQRPVQRAEHLLLELPAVAFGEQGTLYFRIPKEMIGVADTEPEPQDPAEQDETADPADDSSRNGTGQDTAEPVRQTEKPGDGDENPDDDEPDIRQAYPELFNNDN